MSQLEILKLLQAYGDETDLADFTPEELQELLDRMNADGDGVLPLTPAAFKEKYFAPLYRQDFGACTRKLF